MEFRETHPDDFAAARRYVVERLGHGLVDQDGIVVNKKGERLGIVPVQVQQDGTIIVLINSRGQLLHHHAVVDWVVVLDVNTSRCSFIRFDKLLGLVKSHAAGAAIARINAEWYALVLQYATARAKFFAKEVELAKDGPAYKDAAAPKPERTTEQFVHLHVHSMYSFLDGVSSPEGIAKKAYDNGQPGIALTDHGYGFGQFKFYKACREVGVKSLLGIEFYVVDDVSRKYHDANGAPARFQYHTTVLAMNQVGWQNLCWLASEAAMRHFYYVPQIDHKMLLSHSEGLIVTSGCFRGPAAWHLQHHSPDPNRIPLLDHKGRAIYRRDPDYVKRVLAYYKKVLGDRFYVEAQAIDHEPYMQIVPELLEIAHDLGIPVVATNDCHYEKAEDVALQQVLSKIANRKDGDDGNRFGGKGVYYIKKRAEIEHPAFTDDMFTRTCEVMERCNVHIPLPGDDDFHYLFPRYPVESDSDWDEFRKKRGAE